MDKFIKSAVLIVNKCDDINDEELFESISKMTQRHKKNYEDNSDDTTNDLLECYKKVLPFLDSIITSKKQLTFFK